MRRGRQVILAVVLGICACLVFTGSVQAVIIPFYGITDNDPGSSNVAVGEEQLLVEVTNGGPSVTFTFYNIGSSQCTITDVYFDDGTLLELTGLIDKDDGTGGDLDVDFSTQATPGNLPGGGMMPDPFVATEGFTADSDPSPPRWGVSPGESLGVEFSLITGEDLGDVLQELLDTTLRIGIHVQNFEGGGSESFVNEPIPEPATMALLGLGVLLLRKRRA